jgi:hypothetical protein
VDTNASEGLVAYIVRVEPYTKKKFKPLEVQDNTKKKITYPSFDSSVSYSTTLAVSILYSVDDRMIHKQGAMGQMKINMENLSTRRNQPHCHFFHTQIPYELTWDRTRREAGDQDPEMWSGP